MTPEAPQPEAYMQTDGANFTDSERTFKASISTYFRSSSGTELDKLNNFTRFVPRQALSLFLARQSIFEKVVTVHGAIVECGVFMGGGVFTWAQLSAIYEPYNHNRRIIGFDTFAGFVDIGDRDGEQNASYKKAGALRFDAVEELSEGARLFDLNRPIGHIPKIELVRGDAATTIPRYVEDNPHLVVSLLYLDFDLYEPTIAALRHLLPRMPKGAIIGFDELNQKPWPGETLAVLEAIGLSNLRIQRMPFLPTISYAVIGD